VAVDYVLVVEDPVGFVEILVEAELIVDFLLKA
jgi:hypothetical protein